MKRLLASLLLVPWALAASPTGAQTGEVLFRASATATAVHGFYDHEGLFPVPLLNVSVPYTTASVEPGPATHALGSFLWDPEVAELGTILCVLSEGQFCDFPEYPFRAEASYPAAGRREEPPTLSVDEPGSPVRARAAHESARATEDGAAAEASVAALHTVPMSPPQAAAARGLAASLAPVSGPLSVTPWLVEVRDAASTSAVRTEVAAVEAVAESEVHGLRLLGGLITAEVIRGVSTSAIDERKSGSASARVVRLRVGDLRAKIGPRGLRLADQEVGSEQLASLADAVDEALGEAGMEIGPGLESVRRGSGSVESMAYAFSLDLRRRNLPEQFPEGTQGADVVRVAVGLAVSRAEVAQILPPPDPGPPPPPPGAPSGTVEVAGGPGAQSGLPEVAGPPPGAPEAVAVAPTAGITDLGVPVVAVVAVGLAALGAVLLLSWLKVNEVLSE